MGARLHVRCLSGTIETPMNPTIQSFYSHPAGMTSAGACAGQFKELPKDPASLAGTTQGLILHEHIAPAYGVTLTDERRREVHLRSMERVLGRILELDDRPLSVTRPVEHRIVGNCRTYSVLMTAMLRDKGVPARARCGFGAYFEAGQFVDHWVCEHWDDKSGRWIRVDAQIDDVQRKLFKTDFNLLDVPRNQFLIAGDAWAQCRQGKADPNTFGILEMHGLWFIAGNLIRDFAALNNMEMLPWDVWDAMAAPDEKLSEEQLAFFDKIAALTLTPDESFKAVRELYQDKRLKVPDTVFNAILNRPEPV